MSDKTLYVIVPVFNGEQFLERCINSILNQTFLNYVVLFINDGSTDNSLEILHRYESKKIIVIDQKNMGVSAARNAGLDFIKEKDCLLTFLDADDYIDNDYFEVLVNGLYNNNVDIYCCSYVSEYIDRCRKVKHISTDSKLTTFEATNLLVLDRTIQSHSPCKIYKKFVWEDVRYPVGVAWMEDQATIFKTFCRANNGVFVSNYAGYHYWQGSSACRGNKITNKRVLDSLKGYLEPYLFEYSNFTIKEKNTLHSSAANALASVYLMLIPYLKKRQFTNEERVSYIKIKKIIKSNKIIRDFQAKNKNEKLKKMAYIFVRPFYSILYKLFS